MEYCKNKFNNYYEFFENQVSNYVTSNILRYIINENFFKDVDSDKSILNVDIQNGESLLHNKAIIKSKNLSIYGLNSDEGTIIFIKDKIKNLELMENIKIIKDLELINNTKYDIITITTPFLNIQDCKQELKKYINNNLLKDNGEINFTLILKNNIKEVLNYLKIFDDLKIKNQSIVTMPKSWYPILGDLHIYTFNISFFNHNSS